MTDRVAGGLNYLLQELPHHIQGRRSNACIRSISHTARVAWNRSGTEGLYLPGNIPDADSSEVVRLIVWIASGKNSKFITNSSDAACFARVVADSGLELLMVGRDVGSQDENRLTVVLSTSATPAVLDGSGGRYRRRGVRIPLNDLEQCVTLWPGDSKDRVKYRRLFRNGALAAQGIRFVVGTFPPLNGEDWDICYGVEDTSGKPREKNHTISSITRLIIRSFLLLINLSAVEAITRLTASWPTEASCMIEEKMMNSHPRHMFIQDIGFLHLIARDCLTQLGLFVLGYYYAVLSSLVDASQLPVQEAYGAWGWNYTEILTATWDFVHTKVDKSQAYPRHQITKLI